MTVRSIARHVAAEPLESLIGVISLLSAAAYTFGAPLPGSLDSTLPHWFLRVWGVYLLAGGIAIVGGITGGFYRAFILGLLILAAGVAVYATAILFATRLHGSQLQGAVDYALAAALVIRAYRKGTPWIRL